MNTYYYARDEKLLVEHLLLRHSIAGNHGPGRTPLDWAVWMRIASAAAHGLAYIHHSSRRGSGTPRLVHGNIKSTNILLDKAGVARLADCGLALLGSSPAAAAVRSAGYRGPEAPPPAAAPTHAPRAWPKGREEKEKEREKGGRGEEEERERG
uniref:Protein kinase domain-containing protein n=1 Tax=Oryza glumipatula TaxID=40148 RepID=A0A0D9ZVY7_9ORYZ